MRVVRPGYTTEVAEALRAVRSILSLSSSALLALTEKYSHAIPKYLRALGGEAFERTIPVSLASVTASGSPPSGLKKLGGVEAENLTEQVKQGNLNGLREYLARTRTEANWNDRIFMLQLVVRSIRLAALNFACEAEPEAADLSLIRCAFYSDLAKTMRGSGTSDEVTKESFGNSAECIRQLWRPWRSAQSWTRKIQPRSRISCPA